MKFNGIPEAEIRDMEEHCNRQIAELEAMPNDRAAAIGKAMADLMGNLREMHPDDVRITLRFVNETAELWARLMSQHTN